MARLIYEFTPLYGLYRITDEQVIVSLTTFPARIDKVHLCVQSILRQSRPADKVILWLAQTQFPDFDRLPESLKSLADKGLEIRFCDDLKSYKKFFYTALEYADSIIVTADDDVFYPEDWIERLLIRHIQHKDCVICYRAHKITFKDGVIAPYLEWLGSAPGIIGPAMDLVPTGVGGVLYPQDYFKGIDMNVAVIRDLCPTADDLWLRVIGIKGGYDVVKVDAYSKDWFKISGTQENGLAKINVENNGNDKSMKKLVEFYGIDRDILEGKRKEAQVPASNRNS